MKFKHDFINDWCAILKDVLIDHYNFSNTIVNKISNDELPFKLFYFEERMVKQKSRRLYTSSEFNCPVDMVNGWEFLKKKINDGSDLTPHLSKGIKDLDYKDKMLNEWGIYHFHLGTTMEGNFIKRTGPLLYAFITDQAIYAINIYRHNQWAEDTILQTIHDNWPDLISNYKVSDSIKTATTVTPSQRISLRKVNGNAFFTATDGTIYVPTGGGSVASGYNLLTTTKVIKTKSFINEIGKMLDSPSENLKEKLISAGYSENEEVDATLLISETEYSVYFPKHKALLKISTHRN